MKVFNFKEIAKSERIDKLKEALFESKPEIESSIISKTKKLPHYEAAEEILKYLESYIN